MKMADKNKARTDKNRAAREYGDPSTKDWSRKCEVCGATPVVAFLTVSLCGPCCFGEADTAGGNW